MKLVYIDVCCLNRPFDDQTQDRIRLESEAVLIILSQCMAGKLKWISSEVVEKEIAQTPDKWRQNRVKMLTSFADSIIKLNSGVIRRAEELELIGFGGFDALYLAAAEHGKADVLLTTDDGFEKIYRKHKEKIKLKVSNPLMWLEEGCLI